MKPYLASLIRHVATCLGGYLIAKGHAEIGGLVTALGAAWGSIQKRSAKQKLAAVVKSAAPAAIDKLLK